MKKSVYLLAFFAFLFVGCGTTYDLSDYDEAPAIRDMQRLENYDDLADIELDLFIQVLEIDVDDNKLSGDDLYLFEQFKDKVNNGEVYFQQYELNKSQKLKGLLEESLGKVVYYTDFDNTLAYLIKTKNGIGGFIYSNSYNSGTYFFVRN
ncbi:MAG: hypothetical protein ACM3O3_07285 [Syntrophothermus sp.]